MAASKATFFTWTDEEVECLLRLTIKPRKPASAGNEKGFPHKVEELTKTALTTKLKAVRVKYRHAVDSGRKSGHGRDVLLYFDFCEKIWGGSPATRALGSGIETTDIMDPDTAVS